MRYTRVSANCFTRFLSEAWDMPKGNTTVGAMLDPDALNPEHYDETARCFLANDCKSGFVVRTPNGAYRGDLQTVWSSVKDRGVEIVSNAIRHGAGTLDCFDGYLPKFYARLGFKETKREANWTEGEPDVVYMALS